MRKTFIVILFFLSAQTFLFSQNKADVKYWVIFKDKGIYSETEAIVPGTDSYEKGKSLLTERAIKRRLKVLTIENLIGFSDLPVEEKYITQVEKSGIEIIAKSKWLNGISAYMTKEQLEKVKKFDFVFTIKAVNKLYKQNFVSISPIDCSDNYSNILFNRNSKDVFNYGKSLEQIAQIKVNQVHNLGITGKGVLIASFDDGFEWRMHESLKDLNITDEYDFVNKDYNVSNEELQKYDDTYEQGAHGTTTLSSMGGFKEGKLIGPAFNSEFILAKTEYVPSETPMEEDFWLEAAEWAEAKGVDIITSSLVYKAFDEPYSQNSYKYEDFNGKTAITSIAAVKAAHLGVIVLNAMGNYFQTGIPSLGSAADADSILSVGAVSNDGTIANFSSNGPTSDGRTKPEVCAPGVSVYVASKSKSNAYEYSNGTSYATPITAGVCALILSAHPELTPMQVREALCQTASNSGTPNNIMGWGIINAYDALLYFGMVWSNDAKLQKTGEVIKANISLASKNLIDNSKVKIFYSYDGGKNFNEESFVLFESNGDNNKSGEYTGLIKNIPDTGILYFYFYAKDFNGNEMIYPLNADKSLEKCKMFNY